VSSERSIVNGSKFFFKLLALAWSMLRGERSAQKEGMQCAVNFCSS